MPIIARQLRAGWRLRRCAGINTFRAGRLDELQSHPTVKPVALVADAKKDCPRRGDTCSTPSASSAERVGRRGSATMDWTRLPMISTLDDICWIWSKRASSTSVVASLYRLAVVPFHLVQFSVGERSACLFSR